MIPQSDVDLPAVRWTELERLINTFVNRRLENVWTSV